MFRSHILFLSTLLVMGPLQMRAQLGPLNWTGPQKVEANNIFMLWHDEPQVGNEAHAKLYDYNFRNDALPIAEKFTGTSRQSFGVAGQTRYTHAATGKFNVGAREQAVAIWGPSAGAIHIRIPDFDTTAGGWSNAGQATLTGGIQNDRIYVRTLDLDGDSLDEFVVAYLDNTDSIRFALYDVDSLLQPVLIANFSDRKAIAHVNGRVSYAIATGDLDGDGDDELVLLRNDGPSGFYVNFTVQVYDFDGTTLVAKGHEQESTGFNSPLQEVDMSILVGEFIAGGGREVAICLSLFHGSSFRKVHAQVGSVSSDLQTLSFGGYFTPSFSTGGIDLGAAAGDLFGDEREEIVLVAGKTVFLMRMTNGDSLLIAPSIQALPSNYNAFGNSQTRAMHDHVRITDVDQDGRKDIMMAYDILGSGAGGFYLRSFSVDPAGAVSVKGELVLDEGDPVPGTDPALYEFRPFSLAVGNFDGKNFTIGQPTHHVVQGLGQPIVMLHAPPVHFDVLDGSAYDLNQCYNGGVCDFGATYRKQTTTSIEVSTTVQSDWKVSSGTSSSGSISVGVSAEAAPLGVGGTASVEVSVDYEHHCLVTYGENFSNTSTSSTTLSVGVEVTATEDDRIYATVTDYDVWEYPLYHGNETFPRSTILTLVPLNVQATWFPSKSYSALDNVPDHEVGHVLSYPAYADLSQNPQLGQAIAADYNSDSFVLDASSDYNWFLSMSDFQSNSADTVRETGADIGFGLGPFRFDGDYSQKRMNTHTITVTNQIDINVHLGGVDMGIGDAKYTVTPYAYWDKNGALVVDYAARPEIAPPGFPPTWWEQQYGMKPDPTFVLPWRLDPEKGFSISEPAKRKQTKDIFFTPRYVLPGDTVTVTARVRNFSLMGTLQPITVHFYLGDPAAGGVPLDGLNGTNMASTTGPLPAQGREDVELRWTIPGDLPFYPRIYAVIDQDGLIDEIHEDNNGGFNVMWYNGGSTDILEIPEEVVVNSTLGACYPNPFDASTTIPYTLLETGRTTIVVFDQMGRQVAELMDAIQPPGTYQLTFDARGLAGGVYYYSLLSGNDRDTRKMVVMR